MVDTALCSAVICNCTDHCHRFGKDHKNNYKAAEDFCLLHGNMDDELLSPWRSLFSRRLVIYNEEKTRSTFHHHAVSG